MSRLTSYLLDATGFYSLGLHALGIHIFWATGTGMSVDYLFLVSLCNQALSTSENTWIANELLYSIKTICQTKRPGVSNAKPIIVDPGLYTTQKADIF
ncbi:hypothetical protein P3L10_026175 [Capsicum annuum]